MMIFEDGVLSGFYPHLVIWHQGNFMMRLTGISLKYSDVSRKNLVVQAVYKPLLQFLKDRIHVYYADDMLVIRLVRSWPFIKINRYELEFRG